jgi:Trypsin
LIHDDILLTSAQCSDVFSTTAAVDGINIVATNAEQFGVLSVLIHPDFNSYTIQNDIMLVKIDAFSNGTHAGLNFDTATPEAGDAATILGFGWNSTDWRNFNRPQQVKIICYTATIICFVSDNVYRSFLRNSGFR